MLGFGPTAGVVPAGSPDVQAVTVHVIVGTPRVINVDLGSSSFAAGRVLTTFPRSIGISGMGAVGRQREFHVLHAQISLALNTARLYKSAYFVGDPETIRVPAEVTRVRVAFEPRTLVIGGVPVMGTTGDQEENADPRMRKT